MTNTTRLSGIANKVACMSGYRTSIYRRHTGDIDVWHGKKKRRFGTYQAAKEYLDRLYNLYV